MLSSRYFLPLILCSCTLLPGQTGSIEGYDDTPLLPKQPWKVHDRARPRPRKVTPGGPLLPPAPPSDAVVLFDGKDLSKWMLPGKTGNWKVANGYFEVVPQSGSLATKEKFGDCQLHIEWMVPEQANGTGQDAGNSGVLLMGRYEIQVLNSYDAVTYADGQASALYGQYPPLVNASRPKGQWQSYDIVFEAPRFEGDKLTRPAYATVFHNGVLVHSHREIVGTMMHRVVGTYTAHAAEEPLTLQDHGTPVRYRNIWIRKIEGYDRP